MPSIIKGAGIGLSRKVLVEIRKFEGLHQVRGRKKEQKREGEALSMHNDASQKNEKENE